MTIIRSLAVVSIFALLNSAAWATDQEDHKAHHPAAAASSGTTTKSDAKKTTPEDSKMHEAMAQESMEKMDSQIKMMNQMHEKMLKAKTPNERKALMAEHMKAMQGGMAMMGDMSKSGGMAMMGNMQKHNAMGSNSENKMQDGMQCDMGMDMKAHHTMMMKRMQMMETMMQMMMDRMTP